MCKAADMGARSCAVQICVQTMCNFFLILYDPDHKMKAKNMGRKREFSAPAEAVLEYWRLEKPLWSRPLHELEFALTY